MKRVILIGPAHPYRGGIAQGNEALARAYQDLGYHVALYTFTLQYPEFLFPGKTQETDTTRPSDLTIHRTIHSMAPWTWSFTARKILADRPSLVVVRYWIPFLAPSLASICKHLRRQDVRVIALIDNIIPHEKRIGDHFLTNLFLKHIDAVTVMSQSVKNDLLQQFKPDVPVLLHAHPVFDHFGKIEDKGLAKSHFHLFNKKTILFFGLVRAYKGLDLLIKAVALAKKTIPNLHLIVAGEHYEDPKKYEHLIHTLNLQKDISLHNQFISDSDVKNYFNAADLVVLPYKHASQSGVIQVAIHFEKPLLVSRVGGLYEGIEEHGLGMTCKPNVQSMTEHIIDFFSRPTLVGYTSNIQAYKKVHSWQNMAADMLQFID